MLKFFREIKSIGCACVCVHGLEQGIDSHNYGDWQARDPGELMIKF